jgi:pullulanase-type alpha-1,6-glucosidase
MSTVPSIGGRRPRLIAAVASVLLALPALAGAAAPPVTACDGPDQAVLLQAAGPGEPVQARAVWLDRSRIRWPGRAPTGRFRLYHAAAGTLARAGDGIDGADGALDLAVAAAPAPAADPADRQAWAGPGVTVAVAAADAGGVAELLRGQVWLAHEDGNGALLATTRLLAAAALDDLYGAAAQAPGLGARVTGTGAAFGLWAPTARAVSLCLFPGSTDPAGSVRPMQREAATGIWRAAPGDVGAHDHYAYLVEVFVPGSGWVRNRVTDPYALALSAESRRSVVVDLDAAALKPPGWDAAPRGRALAAATALAIYELHVRDFSIADDSVRPAWRGTYLAFDEAGSRGMRHLRALAGAGITDIHLLPVFDIATIPETGCLTPRIEADAPDSERPQAIVGEHKGRDCYNWGYDPYHFTVPEGSYATGVDAAGTRILEFRRMVMALHAAGLRVGMDVVYNHTSAAGQAATSVLDRIVPGYYHRLDADGAVTTSTCCANTATEHAMMARLMIDSAVDWVRHYRIDSFRFDLMGHQPRAAMERLQVAVDRAADRRVHLLGEGWNFGEVADGARFVQASQLSLPGSGIATFSDRARDAVRGGGCCDLGADQVRLQGWLNGLHYAPNDVAGPAGDDSRARLLRHADLVRVGLAGSLRDFRMQVHDGRELPLSAIDYEGQPAGYAAQPGEVVNYVENHDNPTLFDINALKLPVATSAGDRARVQVLGAAVVAFSQGIAYLHAGQEILRSKSMDRNSYDSGDWFNRIDWSLRDNGFGIGLPPAWDNAPSWPWQRPRLADPAIAPSPRQIRFTRDAVLDLLRIRAGSSLFRLTSSEEVAARLRMLNTGPGQEPTVVVGRLDGRRLDGAGFAGVLYAINVDTRDHDLALPDLAGQPWRLHPVQASRGAADQRPRRRARFDPGTGTLTVPARTAVVHVLD